MRVIEPTGYWPNGSDDVNWIQIDAQYDLPNEIKNVKFFNSLKGEAIC